jgi:FhaA, N-terminal domain/FHA domain
LTVLRAIEQKIEGLFEGVFGRAFRAHVQPVELARKLAKEMDDHRTVSVSRIYVPNEYTVYLAPTDREQFEGYEEALIGELQDYLGQHARREEYELLSPPSVRMETDADLSIGEFGIATRMVQREPRTPEPGEPKSQAQPGATMIYRPEPEPEPEPIQEPEPEALTDLPPAMVRAGAAEYPLERGRLVIGRSRECDIRLADPNVSRKHAEIRQEGTTFYVVDLDSTNGTEVNGRRARRAKLEDGDTILLGSTELVFQAP